VLSYLLDSFCRKPTQPVTARQDSQCTVGLVALVEMQSGGEHLFEKVDGWLNVRNAVLDAPRSETRGISPGTKCQGEVLVPGHQPIGFRDLVEVDGLDGTRVGWQVRANDVEKPGGPGELRHDGHRQQAPPPGACDSTERFDELLPLGGRQDMGDDRESLLVKQMAHRRTRKIRNGPKLIHAWPMTQARTRCFPETGLRSSVYVIHPRCPTFA